MIARKRGPKPVDPEAKSVGARLRLARRVAGLSQQELGEIIGGVTFQQMQNYETGKNNLRGGDKLVQICEALNITPHYLIGWPDGCNDVAPSKEIIEIARSLRGLSAKQLQILQKAADEFLDRESR
jgi:transcriptional regulator with XRE-family HTH domain